MNRSTVVKSFGGAVLSLAVLTSLGASAEGYSKTAMSSTAQGLPTATIHYSDLDLAKSEGIETLHNRISRAARNVCGPTNLREAGSLHLVKLNKACYEGAVAEGLKQIELAQVASVD